MDPAYYFIKKQNKTWSYATLNDINTEMKKWNQKRNIVAFGTIASFWVAPFVTTARQ